MYITLISKPHIACSGRHISMWNFSIVSDVCNWQDFVLLIHIVTTFTNFFENFSLNIEFYIFLKRPLLTSEKRRACPVKCAYIFISKKRHPKTSQRMHRKSPDLDHRGMFCEVTKIQCHYSKKHPCTYQILFLYVLGIYPHAGFARLCMQQGTLSTRRLGACICLTMQRSAPAPVLAPARRRSRFRLPLYLNIVLFFLSSL